MAGWYIANQVIHHPLWSIYISEEVKLKQARTKVLYFLNVKSLIEIRSISKTPTKNTRVSPSCFCEKLDGFP